jgi:hypothetical protein
LKQGRESARKAGTNVSDFATYQNLETGKDCRLTKMAHDADWLDVLLVVENDKFFDRSRSGTIWGTVYFQIGENEFFPEKGWTDISPAFVAAWLNGLLLVSQGISKQERVPFFDGPLEIIISMPQKGFLELRFTHREKTKITKKVNVQGLLAHTASVARELLSNCPRRGWHNKDTETLAQGIEQVRY